MRLLLHKVVEASCCVDWWDSSPVVVFQGSLRGAWRWGGGEERSGEERRSSPCFMDRDPRRTEE